MTPTTPHNRSGRLRDYRCLTCSHSWRSPHRWQLGPDRRRLFFCSLACCTLYLLRQETGVN